MKVKDYTLSKVIGKGAFATVYLAAKENSEDNTQFAVKVINCKYLSNIELAEVKQEFQILEMVNSNYVVKLQEKIYENGSLYLVQEYCGKQNLNQYISNYVDCKEYIKEETIWYILIQICLGLRYLHSLKIIHRDIKSENIFVSDKDEVKIGDLGVSKISDRISKNDIAGTPLYFSPELCQGSYYTNKTDIWALGCLTYEIASQKMPFSAKNINSLKLKIMKSDPKPIPNFYSNELQAIIARMLDKNFFQRPSANDLLNQPTTRSYMIKFGMISEPNIGVSDSIAKSSHSENKCNLEPNIGKMINEDLKCSLNDLNLNEITGISSNKMQIDNEITVMNSRLRSSTVEFSENFSVFQSKRSHIADYILQEFMKHLLNSKKYIVSSSKVESLSTIDYLKFEIVFTSIMVQMMVMHELLSLEDLADALRYNDKLKLEMFDFLLSTSDINNLFDIKKTIEFDCAPENSLEKLEEQREIRLKEFLDSEDELRAIISDESLFNQIIRAINSTFNPSQDTPCENPNDLIYEKVEYILENKLIEELKEKAMDVSL